MRSYNPEASGEGSNGLLDEERESFTQLFAYDHYQWPAFKVFGQARPTAMEFRTPAQRAAEDRGLEGDDPAAPYTTTNSSIPIYKTGEVVELDADAVLPQTRESHRLVDLDDYRADPRFHGFDGSGQAIVILDTGIDLDDPFFGPDANGDGISDRIVYQYDFADNDANAGDVDGHGSNVASIAASSDSMYVGMAPGADIIALKVFSNSGTGYFSDIEESLQWVIQNAAAYNIASVNMSLGDVANHNVPVSKYGIGDELATLAAMNIIVVSSSGNDFYEFNSVQGVSYPAADPNSLSVGAVYDGDTGGWYYYSPDGSIGATAYTTEADRIAPFSQRDDQLTDVMAPGAEIVGAGAGSVLTSMHGTSQAAPHITGIVALAQQLATEVLGRRLTFDEFQTLLQSSADFIIDGDDEDDNVASTGLAFPRVNVAELGDAILEMAFPGADTFFSISNPEIVKSEGNLTQTAYTFTITRSGDTTGTATIDVDVTGNGSDPVTADDFSSGALLDGTLTFFAGQTSRSLTVFVKSDSDFESDESFTLSLSNPSGASAIIRSSATGTILNDDSPAPGTIATLVNADFNGSASGTENFTYVAGAFGGTTSPVYTRGNWTTTDVEVTLGGSGGGKMLNMSGGWGRSFTLAEDMEVTLSFVYEVMHSGQTEVAEYTRVLYSFDGGPAVVIDQIAGNGDGGPDHIIPKTTYEVDFGLLSAGTHSFVLGSYLSQKNQPDEYSITSFDDVTITGVIPVPTETFLAIAPLSATGDEGDAGATDFTFTVTRSGVTTGATTVDWTVSGAGAAADDFAGGTYPGGTVTFAAGETSKTVTVQVAGDTDYESDEGFTVTLSNPSVGAIVTTASAGATIGNDDLLVPGEVIALVDAGFDSGSDGFTYTRGLFGGTTDPDFTDGSWSGGEIIIELGGDAANGAKMLNMTGGWENSFTLLEDMEVTLSFDYRVLHAGGTEASEYTRVLYSFDGGAAVMIDQIAGDGDGGPDHVIPETTYEVDLGLLEAGTYSFVLGGHMNQRNNLDEYATIHFDDVTVEAVVPVPTDTFLAIAPLSATGDEGDAGATDFTFTVTRSGVTTGATTVDWTVSGAGAAADDFTGGAYPGGTVSFAAGETSKTVTVQVAGDTDYESDEGFTVTLSNPSAGAIVTTASAGATIGNDDVLVPGEVIALVDAGFDSGSDGFSYTRGLFGGTTDPDFTDGSWSGGEIAIELGGDAANGAKMLNMTGGWENSFTLLEDMEVTLSFDYRVLHAGGTEASEYTQVLYSFDGGPAVVIDQIAGNGDGGPDHVIPQTTYEVDLGLLSAGTYSFVLGGYLSQKNNLDEYATIHFDDVVVEGVVPVGGSAASDVFVEGRAATAPAHEAALSLDDLLAGDSFIPPMPGDTALPNAGLLAGLSGAGPSETELLATAGL